MKPILCYNRVYIMNKVDNSENTEKYNVFRKS